MERKLIIHDETGTLEYYPKFISRTKRTFESLKQELIWSKPSIKIFGKTHPIPREQAFYGEQGISYKYSGTIFSAIYWDQSLLKIKRLLEEIQGDFFNCVLCNLYSHGGEYMSLHSDNEPELGQNPVIASVSLGESRIFNIQRKDKSKKQEIELNNGDVLFMRGKFQEYWNHGIKKTTRKKKPRINLTFRHIKK